MSCCKVTLSANAGIALDFGGLRLWADALHDEKVPGFSTVTPSLWTAMRSHPAFAAPDLLFFTHCHPDHFSRTLTRLALERWPKAKPILPETFFPEQLLLSGGPGGPGPLASGEDCPAGGPLPGTGPALRPAGAGAAAGTDAGLHPPHP